MKDYSFGNYLYERRIQSGYSQKEYQRVIFIVLSFISIIIAPSNPYVYGLDGVFAIK